MMRRLAALAGLALAAGTAAAADLADLPEAAAPRLAADATLYAYAGSTQLPEAAVLDPGNRLARQAQRRSTLDARLDLKAETEVLRFTARPILLRQVERVSGAGQATNEAYLSQWQARFGGETVSAAVGREVMNWGPAQFKSPSSPFYFDNGRGNPLRELSGVDAVKASWAPDAERSLSIARITGSGHVAGDPWRDVTLLKGDWRGVDAAAGLALAQLPGRGRFIGAHGQWMPSDALLLYGEAGASRATHVLISSADATQPFAVVAQGPRRSTTLVGGAWTREDGHTWNLEYLHDARGYSAAEERAYFDRAAASAAAAGMALGLAPALLGRDYLHLVWQSNLLDSAGYWRLMATRKLTDGSVELGGYGERPLTSRVAAFALGSWAPGDARREFAAVVRRSVVVGFKVFMP